MTACSSSSPHLPPRDDGTGHRSGHPSTSVPCELLRNSARLTIGLTGMEALVVGVKLTAEADGDWPRKDNLHPGLERPGAVCRSGSA